MNGSVRLHGENVERKREKMEYAVVQHHPGMGTISKATEGEQVAAGWPGWLAVVAGEAIRGWLPRRADSFEKLDKDPVLCSVTVGVSHFERCAFCVQVLYYPFYGSGALRDYDGDYAEEDPQIMRQKRSLKPELGEPMILRCQPYKLPLTELLLPHKISPVEFFRQWPSLPAIVEFTGTYTYEGSGFKATAAQQYGTSPFFSGLKSLSSKPFHTVCSHIIRAVAGFQLCYAAKTWYSGFLGMMVFGASEVSRNVDLGDETTTMMCKFVVRASDASITKEIGSDLQGWLDDLTDGGVEYMPEDEVKVAAAESLRISMERTPNCIQG